MAHDPDNTPDDPTQQLKQGLGLLWKAARGMAKGLERTDLGKAIDDAGREIVRATSTVVERIASEVTGKPSKHGDKPDMTTPKEPDPHGRDDDFDGVKPKPKPAKPTGPTPEDPGFRIMVDDDEKKPR